jgi:hypothetical protein
MEFTDPPKVFLQKPAALRTRRLTASSQPPLQVGHSFSQGKTSGSDQVQEKFLRRNSLNSPAHRRVGGKRGKSWRNFFLKSAAPPGYSSL